MFEVSCAQHIVDNRPHCVDKAWIGDARAVVFLVQRAKQVYTYARLHRTPPEVGEETTAVPYVAKASVFTGYLRCSHWKFEAWNGR